MDWHFGNIHFHWNLRIPIHLNLYFLGWDIKFFWIFNIFIRLKSIIRCTSITYNTILNKENTATLIASDLGCLSTIHFKLLISPAHCSLVSKTSRGRTLKEWGSPQSKLWCSLERKIEEQRSQETWSLEHYGTWPRDTLAGKSELKVVALKGCELTAFYYNFQALH